MQISKSANQRISKSQPKVMPNQRMSEWGSQRIVGVLLFFSVCLLVAMPVLGQEDGLTISVNKRFGYSAGGQIQGTFRIEVRGPEDLVSVAFEIDDEVLEEVTASPFEVTFETGDYDHGWHEIGAVGKTADGRTLESRTLSIQFISSEAVTKNMVRLIVPILVLVFGATVLSAIVPFLTGRKKQPYAPEAYTPDAPRSYGMLGGTVCPKCGRPFGIHWWGLNISFVGKYDRCPHCGKWSLVRRAIREDQMVAEAAEYAAHVEVAPRSQPSAEDRFRQQVEDSRYTELESVTPKEVYLVMSQPQTNSAVNTKTEVKMNDKLDVKRILIFLAFAFGIAWVGGLVLYLTGGLADSPYTVVILTVVYMGAPSIAHVLTRMITREGWRNTFLTFKLRKKWPYWVIAWFAPGVLSIIGFVVFFVLFPQYYDPEFGMIQQLLEMQAEQTGQPIPDVSPWMIIMSQTVIAMLLAPLLNGVPTFGEEFGWRAYLLPKLMPLGTRKAIVLSGVIWGVWHWPVIAMGHNYGLGYAGAPWGGLLMMVWFTVVAGTLLSWVTVRSGSVWPAVIGHGALNGIAGLGALFVQGKPNPLLGPLPIGLIGSVGFAVLMLVLFVRPGALESPVGEI